MTLPISAGTSATRRGDAGRAGGDVRSDLHVAFEPRPSGGIEIVLRSRVELYYGDVIRQQVRDLLRSLGIEHAFLEIVDEGALPFVIAARIEAAVRRAGLRTCAPQPLLETMPLAAPSPRDRLRRSRLYLPGNEPKYFVNAGLHGPDAVILDLEDSVHYAEKDAARLLVRNALRAVDFGAAERMVRINQLPLGLTDLEEIVPQSPDLILIPKVETAAQVQEVAAAIDSVANRRTSPSDLADADSRISSRHRECIRDCHGLRTHRRHHHRLRGLHRRSWRCQDGGRKRIALCPPARGERRPRRPCASHRLGVR